jgi:hypothetical protein
MNIKKKITYTTIFSKLSSFNLKNFNKSFKINKLKFFKKKKNFSFKKINFNKYKIKNKLYFFNKKKQFIFRNKI